MPSLNYRAFLTLSVLRLDRFLRLDCCSKRRNIYLRNKQRMGKWNQTKFRCLWRRFSKLLPGAFERCRAQTSKMLKGLRDFHKQILLRTFAEIIWEKCTAMERITKRCIATIKARLSNLRLLMASCSSYWLAACLPSWPLPPASQYWRCGHLRPLQSS